MMKIAVAEKGWKRKSTRKGFRPKNVLGLLLMPTRLCFPNYLIL